MSRPSFPRLSRARHILAGALLLASASLFVGGTAHAKTHTVYAGQRLGSIAKRYNISVDELCQANGITRRSVIKPGQKLIIPGTEPAKSKKSDGKSTSRSSRSEKPSGKIRMHRVAKGHTLSAIAGRYAITVTSLCHANGIGRNASLTVGQNLIIPHKSDKGGKYAAQLRVSGKIRARNNDGESKDSGKQRKTRGSKDSWKKYVKPAWKRGYISIRRYGRHWKGYVIGPKGQVLGHASNKINYVLGATKDGPRIDPKLIRLIASISDKFGGREMRIVSGYRTKSFVAASKHKKGKALDFSIPDIPNEALRDYLRTLDNVGVGYYPNSSFVHLDVRGYNSYWVDHAGPGEAPRKSPRRSKKRSKKRAKKDHGHDHSHGEEKAKKSDSAKEPSKDATPKSNKGSESAPPPPPPAAKKEN